MALESWELSVQRICAGLPAYFVDPGAGDDRAALGGFFCFIKVFGFDHGITGDGVFRERKVRGPRVRNFSAMREVSLVDLLVCNRLEPSVPCLHFFGRGPFKSVVQN